IRPNNDPFKCLDVRGAVFENGTPVQIYDCNGTNAQKWIINKGETKVQVAGTNFCLDAGTYPQNGVGLKIWECYDNLPAQDWWYTDDNRIALTNQGQCVDLPSGDATNSNQVQIWKCTDNDGNQAWTDYNAGDAPAPKTTVALKPGNSSNKCLDVRGAIFENGTPVQIYDCNGTGAQKWVIKNGETKVQLAGTNFCLDAGSSPQNGVGLKIWQCYDNLPAQDWYYTADNRLALTNQGQCVDLPNGDSTNGVQVQIWKCTDNDNYQVWNF
ncbi:carbohydrate-binding module family 13 protein/putative endo-1,3-beta-glucanase, partial [Pluteus cervinus]